MRIEQGVKIFEYGECAEGQGVELDEFFITAEQDNTFSLSGADRISFFLVKRGFHNLDKVLQIAKLLNEDNGGQDNTFPMFDNWKPDIEVSESVLKEFIFFWTGKPDIKKTNEQWLQALAQSQQYADSRNEYYRTKGD